MKAADIMRTWFATVKPSAPLLDAIHLLLETSQRGLPVVDGEGALVGIISEGDFLHRRELGVDYPEGFWLGKDEGQLARERTSGLRGRRHEPVSPPNDARRRSRAGPG